MYARGQGLQRVIADGGRPQAGIAIAGGGRAGGVIAVADAVLGPSRRGFSQLYSGTSSSPLQVLHLACRPLPHPAFCLGIGCNYMCGGRCMRAVETVESCGAGYMRAARDCRA
jgi:hypothetical protein